MPLIQLEDKKYTNKNIFKNHKKNYSFLWKIILIMVLISVIIFITFQIYRQVENYFFLKSQYENLENQKKLLQNRIKEKEKIISQLQNELEKKGVFFDYEKPRQDSIYNFP